MVYFEPGLYLFEKKGRKQIELMSGERHLFYYNKEVDLGIAARTFAQDGWGPEAKSKKGYTLLLPIGFILGGGTQNGEE